MGAGSAEEGGEERVMETETSPPPYEHVVHDRPPHDNYVNFDVAQTVLEANARKVAQAAERGEATHG